MKKTLIALTGLLLVSIGSINAQSEKKEPPPPPPPPKVIKAEPSEITTTRFISLSSFYKKNLTVANVHWQDSKISLKLKNGNRETYDLSNEEEAKSFKEKYGTVPGPPPPPPPPAKKMS